MVLATTAVAAPHPFYQSMLQRGMAQAQEGRYADAIRSLRIAAFGSLDEPQAYQLAQIHLAIANEKLGNTDEARLAATKFLQAERLQPSYEQLTLTDATRNAFEKIVASAVEPQYLAQLPAFRRSSPKTNGAVATRGNDVPVAPREPEKKPESVPPPQKEQREFQKPVASVQPQNAPAMQTAVAQPVTNSVKPQNTPATNVAPMQSATTQPTTNVVKPQNAPATNVAPMQSASAQPTINSVKPQNAPTQSASAQPANTAPKQITLTPAPSSDAPLRLAEAQRLLNEGKLLGARSAYLALSQRRDATRTQMLEIARGLNRTGAWQESAMVYQRAQPLAKGEELHMFYEAVNRYELGELTLARALLTRALPALPQSREVEAYRLKIQGTS